MRCCGLAALVAVVPAAAEAAFSVRGSVEQVYVTDLKPGNRMALLGLNGSKCLRS